MRVFDSAMKGNEYVAEKLSGMSATDGKEGSHRNGPLLVRQIRLERANERCKVFRPRILKDKDIRNVEDDEPASGWFVRSQWQVALLDVSPMGQC